MYKKYKKVHKYKSTHNSVILELQTPDFVWKFICTFQPNEKVQKYIEYKSIKIQKYKSTKRPKWPKNEENKTKGLKLHRETIPTAPS